MLRISDLRAKEVINLADGRRLGLISDLEIDVEGGRVSAIVLPGGPRFLGLFRREEDTVVGWQEIRRIGEDVILVDLPPPGAASPPPERARGRRDRWIGI